MQIIIRRMGHRLVAVDTDEVVLECPLPSGCKLGMVQFEVHVNAATVQTFVRAAQYGFSGFIVPVIAPDTALNVDTLWDTTIRKDIAEGAGAFDLDDAVDVQPEFEPGLIDWGGVFDVAGNSPKEIFRRRVFMTVASHPTVILPATAQWHPVDFWKSRVTKGYRASVHSHILFGFSNPTLDATTTTVPVSLSENEWTIMTFMEDFLKDAMKNLMGLIETGAETPYAEAAAFVAELIENVIMEETAAAFSQPAWNVFGRGTFTVNVPGEIGVGVLTSE